ncbi:uncharacterized protein LOC144922169 [Branchiostoma floridae x Branchiostoma belcheri]
MELSRLHVVFFLAVFLSAAGMYHVQKNNWTTSGSQPRPKMKVLHGTVTMMRNITIKSDEKANQTKYMTNSASAVGQKFLGTPQRLGYRTNVSISVTDSKNKNKLPRYFS